MRNRRWIFRLNLFLSVFTTVCVYIFMPLKKVVGNWKQSVHMRHSDTS